MPNRAVGKFRSSRVPESFPGWGLWRRGGGGYDVGWLANPARMSTPKHNFVSRYVWFAQFLQAGEGWITLTELA
jgi:hypothetical protein